MTELKKSRSVSLTPTQIQRLATLGGSKWVAQQIDEAYEKLPEFVKPRPLPKNTGVTVKFRRFNPMPMPEAMRPPMTGLGVARLLIESMPPAGQDHHLKRLKRLRRRAVFYQLNGTEFFITRTQAIEIAESIIAARHITKGAE